jgi:hypothetical protein
MLVITAKLFDEGRTEKYYGSEQECKNWLSDQFPEARPFDTLPEMTQAVNDVGFAEVEFKPYRESLASNLLPEDFLTHEEIDPKLA